MLKLSGYSRLTWGRDRDPAYARALASRRVPAKVPRSASSAPRKPTPTRMGHRSSRRGDGPRAHFSRPHRRRARTTISAPPSWRATLECDAQADVPSAEASGATCVQRLDDSRDSAIHTKYRISLHSSSWREPRYPLPRVVLFSLFTGGRDAHGVPTALKCWRFKLVRVAPMRVGFDTIRPTIPPAREGEASREGHRGTACPRPAAPRR